MHTKELDSIQFKKYICELSVSPGVTELQATLMVTPSHYFPYPLI